MLGTASSTGHSTVERRPSVVDGADAAWVAAESAG